MSEIPPRTHSDTPATRRVPPSHYVAAIAAGLGVGALRAPDAEAAPRKEKGMERADAIGQLVSKLNAIQARREQIIDEKEFACIVENIYHEARGEDAPEQLRVALTTLSRVIDEGLRFPNTPCGVVFEPKQFSWTLSDTIRNAKKNARQMRKISNLVHALIHGHSASIAVTLLSMSLKTNERPLFYKRTDDVGVSDRSKEFFKLLIPVDVGSGSGAHTFYRLPTKTEVRARAKR